MRRLLLIEDSIIGPHFTFHENPIYQSNLTDFYLAKATASWSSHYTRNWWYINHWQHATNLRIIGLWWWSEKNRKIFCQYNGTKLRECGKCWYRRNVWGRLKRGFQCRKFRAVETQKNSREIRLTCNRPKRLNWRRGHEILLAEIDFGQMGQKLQHRKV